MMHFNYNEGATHTGLLENYAAAAAAADARRVTSLRLNLQETAGLLRTGIACRRDLATCRRHSSALQAPALEVG
jgi:hypothetical protein